eukprot:9415042-Lingulodinium_polyedra.AAC.1
MATCCTGSPRPLVTSCRGPAWPPLLLRPCAPPSTSASCSPCLWIGAPASGPLGRAEALPALA